jgi:hypothetical protein
MKKFLLALIIVVATVSCIEIEPEQIDYADYPVMYAYQFPHHIVAMKYDILPDGQMIRVVDYINNEIMTVKMYQMYADELSVGDTIRVINY